MTALLESMGSFPNNGLQYVRRLMGGGGPGRQAQTLGVLRGVALALLVAFAGWITAGLIWDLTVPAPTAGQGGATLSGGTVATPATPGAGAGSPQLSFFGVGTDANAPVSSGPYSLSGILYSSNPAASRAIVRANQNDAIYAVGDKLPNGQTIAAIERDRVIVTTSAGREALPLPKPELGGGPAPELPAPALPTPPAPSTDSALEAPASINRSMLSGDSLVAALGDIKVTPVDDSGGPGGIRLDEIGGSAILQAMGLQNGDVIKSVNGVVISGEQSIASILGSVARGSSANVVILRNGALARKTIHIVDQ